MQAAGSPQKLPRARHNITDRSKWVSTDNTIMKCWFSFGADTLAISRCTVGETQWICGLWIKYSTADFTQHALLAKHNACEEMCSSYRQWQRQMLRWMFHIPVMEKPLQSSSSIDVRHIMFCQSSHAKTGTSSHQNVSEVAI